MSTAAQIAANQANAQKSSGPKTDEGKAASSQNNLRFGLAGSFHLLDYEKEEEYDTLKASLCFEHQPQTQFEIILIEKMTQHFWVAQRAMKLQDLNLAVDQGIPGEIAQKQIALMIRYQTTHERAFHKCADELRKLRNDRMKQQIGFESHELKKAAEERKQERHKIDLSRAEAKLDHQILLNMNVQSVENPAPFDIHRHVMAQKAA